MTLIRFEEGSPPVCPECYSSDLDSLGVCADCGTCLACFRAEKRGYPEAMLCGYHGQQLAKWRAA